VEALRKERRVSGPMKEHTEIISEERASPGSGNSSRLTGQQVALMIDKTGVTRVTKILVFAASLGYLFDAFDNTIVAYLMPLISKDFAISPAVKGIILSLALWGGMVGMCFWGPVSEAKGRKFGFQGTLLSFSLFTGFASLAWSWMVLGFMRFVAGAGLSGFFPVDVAMVSEMTPTRLRGRLTSSIAMMYPVGVIVAGLVTGALAQKIGWRLTFLIGALPALCAYIIRRSVPESPRWLASRGRTDEALAALKAMGVTQQTIDEVRNTGITESESVDQGRISD
jgi:putative MFS transporter